MTIEDEDLKEYINRNFAETVIMRAEEQILASLKLMQQFYPSEENDENWLKYSDFIVKRRLKNKAPARESNPTENA
jgi:hypothetical protein